MSSQISYTRAAQVGVCAIAIDLYWTHGQTAGALLLGVVGNLGLEYCRRIGQWVANRKHPYRVATQISFADTAKSDRKGITNALKLFRKEFPDNYQTFLKSNKLSENEAVIFMQQKLSNGCCSGTVNAIFHRMCQGQSMKESVCDLEGREVYYYQILENTGPHLELEIGLQINKILDDRIKELEILAKWEAVPSLKVYEKMAQQLNDAMQKMEAETLAEWPKRMEVMNRHHLIRGFVPSEKFPVMASYGTYQRILEQTMIPFGQQDIVGVLQLPQHVVAFQYGSQGYFFWDTFQTERGLSQYPDSDTFFRELVKNVTYDVFDSKYSRCRGERPEASTEENLQETRKRLENTQTNYKIRPLAFLNPANADTVRAGCKTPTASEFCNVKIAPIQ